MLRLTVTGMDSNESRSITIMKSEMTMVDGYYVFVLDDITEKGKHFAEQFTGDNPSFGTGGKLTPGENIRIQAEAYDNTQLTNVAKSPEQKTNSLFGSVTDDKTAQLTSIRHLENLSAAVSGVSEDISKAKQSTDLDWESFKSKTGITGDGDSGIYPLTGDPSKTFIPINRTTGNFEYDGGKHSISNLEVNQTSGPAGLFGTLGSTDPSDTGTRYLHDLELIDPKIQGNRDTGALVGTAKNTTISNIAVRNSAASDTPTVTSTNGNAGGLVGSLDGGAILKSSASVPVKSNTGDAGGLAGTVKDALINACYTGGQTSQEDGKHGTYDENKPNVEGAGSVGGLVGSVTSTTETGSKILSSYSTCSAKGGTATGGLIGSTSGTGAAPTEVKSSYCTGLVTGSGRGAVVGNAGNTTFDKTYYYGIINSTTDKDGYKTMNPVGNNSNANVSGITEMDRDLETFNTFVSMTTNADKPFDPADPYDKPFLGNEYPFNTVNQLGTSLAPTDRLKINKDDFVSVHIGDWPSPETRVINTL